jgi:hypothetical protein
LIIDEDYNFAENQIECPRCGELVHLDLTRCSNCGLNFYLADEEGEWWEANESVSETRFAWLDISFVAIVVGWLVSALLAFGIHYLLAQVYGSRSTGLLGRVVLLLASPAGAFVGGGVVAAIAERRPIPHGFILGVLSVGDAIVLEAYWRDLSLGNLLSATTILGWGLTMLAGVVSAYWYMKRARQEMVAALFYPSEGESQRYDELYMKVGYDEKRVERLIEYERQRAPGKSREEWIERAIQRWDRDNR